VGGSGQRETHPVSRIGVVKKLLILAILVGLGLIAAKRLREA
jgi:hypothetical protein